MTGEERCECCDLPVSMCGRVAEQRLRAQAWREREALLARPGWFEAQYRGVCCVCGEWFGAGTPIRRETDNGALCYLAECCAPETMIGR